MSLRIDTTEWISGALLIGEVGGGVLGSALAATGTNGSGFLSDDVTLPADAGKEICGRITYWPPGLSLFAYEDGGVVASAADGTYVAQYQLYVDYVATGPQTPITFTFGATATTGALAWVEAAETFAASAIAQAPAVAAAAGWIEAAEVMAVAVAAQPLAVVATAAWTEAAESFAAAVIAQSVGVTASAAWVESAEAFAATATAWPPVIAAAAWTEAVEVSSLLISGATNYARAPAGNGYTPQRDERQSRPAAIQRNYR